MAAAVTVENEEEFRKTFFQAMSAIFKKHQCKRTKYIYKGYHFCFQEKDIASSMMSELLNDIADQISRIDLYCGYYDLNQISIFGDSAGQVVKRSTFLERYQHAFHHVCAWKYSKDYGLNSKFKLDHFEGHRTPAWTDLIGKPELDLEVYYRGSECEPIITVSDIVLKLIDLHQHGVISSRTMLDVIGKRCPNFGNTTKKLNYHSMKEYLRQTTPDSTLRINLDKYIKHPIYFIMWNSTNPQEPKERIKPMFEWSSIYSTIAKKAFVENGCFKQFQIERDHLIWDISKDKLVAWSNLEEQMIEQMSNMGFDIPEVIKKNDLKT